MRRVDSTPHSWLTGGESGRGTERVALSQPCRDERVYPFVVGLFLLSRHLHFHTWSRQTIGRVMAGIPRDAEYKRVSALTRGKFSVHVTHARCHPSFFFFSRARNIPVALISVFRNRDIRHSASAGKWQRWFHDGNIVVNCSRPVTRNRHHRWFAGMFLSTRPPASLEILQEINFRYLEYFCHRWRESCVSIQPVTFVRVV